ncbi:MAG TPA: hypothetical protein VF719_10175 [Abditibacteriaceae bacterium]|jgi:hypothetical protein
MAILHLAQLWPFVDGITAGKVQPNFDARLWGNFLVSFFVTSVMHCCVTAACRDTADKAL